VGYCARALLQGDDKFFDNVKLRLALPTAGARTTAAGGVVLDSHVGVDEPTGTTVGRRVPPALPHRKECTMNRKCV
jgi:hypothetical protein